MLFRQIGKKVHVTFTAAKYPNMTHPLVLAIDPKSKLVKYTKDCTGFAGSKGKKSYYRPPEGGWLYDMKFVSGYTFLRTYYF